MGSVKLRKVGEDLVILLPDEIVEKYNLKDGDTLSLTVSDIGFREKKQI
jgi:antitoxin component of MazEF toxin-antitoxin module